MRTLGKKSRIPGVSPGVLHHSEAREGGGDTDRAGGQVRTEN